MSPSRAARRITVVLDITAATAAVAAIGFVVCALLHGAQESCIDRVFWALCIGGVSLLAAILVDRVRTVHG